jgi:hypothetical protein
MIACRSACGALIDFLLGAQSFAADCARVGKISQSKELTHE